MSGQLDRLLFAQGGKCFFCNASLSKTDASIEHLVASANGGTNADENCVVCCRTLNQFLGAKSIKEKLQIVLNQGGEFKCPMQLIKNQQPESQGVSHNKKASITATKTDKPPIRSRVNLILANFKKREKARPGKHANLKNTIRTLINQEERKILSETDLDALVDELQELGELSIINGKVSYKDQLKPVN